MEKRLLDEHQANECPQRMIRCEYCDLEVTFEQFTEHVDFCGARTEKCEKCGKFVQKKEQSQHDATDCEVLLFKAEEELKKMAVDTEPKKTVYVDVEISQGPQKGERSTVTGEKRRQREEKRRRQEKQSKHSQLPNNKGVELTPHVDPDSTILPINVESPGQPVMSSRGPSMNGRPPPANDSEFAWQVAQEVNGLSVKPEKMKYYRPRFNANEPGVQGLDLMNNGVRAPETFQAAALRHGLVIGKSFVLPEGESMDDTLAEQLEWQRVHGGGNQTELGYEESMSKDVQEARDHLLAQQLQEITTMPLDLQTFSEQEWQQEHAMKHFEQEKQRLAFEKIRHEQIAKDRRFAEQLQEESTTSPSSPLDSLRLSELERRQQEDELKHFERKKKKDEEEKLALEKRRRKQLEEDAAFAQQLHEQMNRESSQPGLHVGSRMSELYDSEEEQPQEEAEARRRRQIHTDEQLARELQRELETEDLRVPANLSDLGIHSYPYSEPRGSRQRTNQERQGYSGSEDLNSGEPFSRRYTSEARPGFRYAGSEARPGFRYAGSEDLDTSSGGRDTNDYGKWNFD
jgi:hypothetical protein